MSESNKKIEFKGTVVRCVYKSDNFSTYALDVDTSLYPDIKLNSYKNVSLIGDLSELVVGVQYDIIATEEESKYGTSYRAVNVKRDVPTEASTVKAFLNEILTANQADVLFAEYPNIIDIVRNGEDYKVDVSKLYGIGEKTLAVIKRKIIENFQLADLVGEFGGAVSISMLKKIYDKYPDIDVLRAKLKEVPYETLTRLSGIGFKKADAIVLELQEKNIISFEEDVRTSKDRCLSCIIYLLQENEKEGNTRMNLADLRGQCIKMIPECVGYFADAIKSDSIYYNKDNMSIGLTYTYNAEKYIAEMIAANIATNDVWEYDVEKYRNIGEFELSDEQMCAIKNVCKYGVSILNGGGGSGKTYTTKTIIKMLDDNNKTYLLLAPTGKAGKVLSEYTSRQASTVHRGLGYNPKKGWAYNVFNKLPYSIVVVDEFSMMDVSLFKHLLEAIDFESTRLLIVGDNAQLPSVGSGNLLHDFMESGIIPTTTLTKVFRYAEGGLSKIATDVRHCKPYLNKSMRNKATTFGDNKDYTFIDMAQEVMPKNIVALYKKLVDSGIDAKDVQVLTSKNVGSYGTIVLNSIIQKAVNKNYGSELHMKIGDTMFFKDDLVMATQNNYHAKINNGDGKETSVFNGDTGVIKYVCQDYAVMDFDGVEVRYDKSEMIMISLSYAITAHKSQGSSIENVIVCTPKADSFFLNSNIVYVMLTRMKKRCYHYGNIDTVNKVINKKANFSRNTFMQQLLTDTVVV